MEANRSNFSLYIGALICLFYCLYITVKKCLLTILNSNIKPINVLLQFSVRESYNSIKIIFITHLLSHLMTTKTKNNIFNCLFNYRIFKIILKKYFTSVLYFCLLNLYYVVRKVSCDNNCAREKVFLSSKQVHRYDRKNDLRSKHFDVSSTLISFVLNQAEEL